MTLEITIREAEIIRTAIASMIPSKADEMITFMLYHRIAKKIDEQDRKNESS